MNKFNKTYQTILEDIVQSVTPEEKIERQKKYHEVRLKLIFNELFDNNNMSKNADGSYDIDGDIELRGLNLISLKDLPYKINKVNGYFDCSHNKLRNLEGCPKEVDGFFTCFSNNLTSLEGCPVKTNGFFSCSSNRLTSLKGCPTQINGNFNCCNNKLTSLEGLPTFINGDAWIKNMINGHRFNKKEIRKVCEVNGDIYV